ncbi:MAG TPA: response regulator, partial [Chryseosolibacter sp.]|nr:response regulator [Chryseosolibacter sp.]
FYGDGLYRYDYQSHSLTPFFQDRSSENFIQSRVVFSLNFDGMGKLWIGTAGSGLFCYDVGGDILHSFSESQGLSNNTVYSILIDKNNNSWVSTNSGVSKIESKSGKIVNYESLDGLQGGQFNPNSGMQNNIGGYMCFGGTQGLNVFYPEQIKEEVYNPKVTILGLQIFNRPVFVRDTIDGVTILPQVINKTETLTLEHDQSVITFEFVGLNYTYPEKTHYAYMMEGLDKQWNFVGHQRSATYRYLKPGDYTFKVKASNQENAWGQDFTSLKVRIKPPMWRTPLAYFLYALGLMILTFVFIRVGRKQLSLRKRLKIEKAQRKHEQRMAKEKLTFFTEISHEFRTPLTLIMGPLEDMLSRENDQSPNWRKLSMVHRNASKLLNLINKLLDYRKIESGNVILKVAETDIVPFIEEIFETFGDLAKKKNINFTFQAAKPSINVWFDREKMEMVISNILSNSFKYIGKGNEINIHVSHQITEKYPLGRVVIKIRDNGIGIPKKDLRNVFDWFYKGENSGTMNSGIGLSLAKKLVHLHKGEIFVESTPGNGSVFSIKIPLGKDHFKPEEVTISKAGEADGGESLPPVANDSPEDTASKKGIQTLLLVEDDDEIREFLKEYFQADYKIFEAVDGDQGVEMANSIHPDLIISDIMMPGKDGIELCRTLKENVRTSHIPIILLTARTSLVHHKEGIETGADAYLTKPFSPEILALTVNNLLESRQQLMRFYRNLFINTEPSVAQGIDVNSPDEKFLHSVYDLLKSNLDKPDFHINELADALNMSRSLVYKKIKMLTGLSAVEYVRSLRMQEAAKLLRSQNYKVFEVVYMVGFSDLKYFRQCFAKEFGVSPSEYMKRQSEHAE